MLRSDAHNAQFIRTLDLTRFYLCIEGFRSTNEVRVQRALHALSMLERLVAAAENIEELSLLWKLA